MMHNITHKTLVDGSMGIYPSLAKTFIEYDLPCQIFGEPFWGTINELNRQHIVDANALVDKLDELKKKLHEKS